MGGLDFRLVVSLPQFLYYFLPFVDIFLYNLFPHNRELYVHQIRISINFGIDYIILL